MKTTIKKSATTALIHLSLLLFTFLALSAHGATYHVSKTGNDSTGDGSTENPYATIQKAVDRATTNDWIYVAGGEYVESVALPTYRNVSGSWNDAFSARDLRNGRTLVKSSQTSKPCISITGSGTNVLVGLTLTGGSSGIQSRASGGGNDSATYHHVFSQLIISNNVNGLDFNGGWVAPEVKSSLISDNSGYAFHHYADHGTKSFFRNCTFANNEKAFHRQWIWAQAIETRNCTYLHNVCENYHNGARSYNVNEYDSLHYGNGKLFEYYASTGGLDTDVGKFYLKLINRHYMFDPKVDARTFVPLSGSPIQGLGADQSANGVDEDVYGTPWNGVYDLGCAKGPDAPAAKAAELWVASGGSDAASGADSEHPLKTINEAISRLAPNGTVHVADGTYEEEVALCVPGMKLVGGTAKKTVIRPPVDGTVKIGGYYKTWNFGLGIFAPDVTVSNVTVRSAYVGIYSYQNNETAGTRATIAASILRDNVLGFVNTGTGTSGTYTHLQIRDNVYHGIYTASGGKFIDLLVADNGGTAIYQQANSQRGASSVVNCTLVDNGGWGWYDGEGSPNSVKILNCIIGGNASGGVYQKSGALASYCCFYGNGAGGDAHWGTGSNSGTGLVYADPHLDTTDTLRGHLPDNSPCSQVGSDPSTFNGVAYAVPDDLDYVGRLAAKMDLGCYDSPETINDLAGQGYHVVNVVGDPNGYGEPEPNYGRTLMKDQSQTLDVGCTLTTDPRDGRRNQSLGVGVRARYLGYEALNEETQAKTSSATDETYVFPLVANTTFTIKWVVEDLLTLTGGQPGCKVKVNDGEPAETLHVWVPRGEPVTVTAVPSDDWAHSQWEGEVSAAVDPKEASITWTSDGPRTFSPVLRGVHYVSTEGSDDDDGTRAHPWRTIGHAIADASTHEYDEIKVQAGVYEESVTNAASRGGVNHLTLTGCWNADWERDLLNARTVVMPPAEKLRQLPCLYMDTQYNTVHGFTFTGGSAGIVSKAYAGSNESTTHHHELSCLIVTNNVNGIDFGQSFFGAVLASSLIADNTGYGYYHYADRYADRGARDYFYNCTFAGNGAEGIRRGSRLTNATMRNCVFDGNGVDVRIYSAANYPVSVYASCFGGAVTSSFMSASIAVDGDSPASFYRGTMFALPQLDEARAPTAYSPFLGMGQNLIQDSVFAFGTDVYGRHWNGVWDYGCFKSAFAARSPSAVQYVAADGDDRNDGLTEANPRRSLGAALAALTTGGTIHAGPGTYEPVVFDRNQVQMLGAGPGRSFIANSPLVAARGAVVPAVTMIATNDVVEGFTMTNAYAGVYVHECDYTRNAAFRDCTMVGCVFGVRALMGSHVAGHHLTFDRCRVIDNSGPGFYIQTTAYITSSLIARNGGYGIYVNPWDTFDQSYAVNCSILDNAWSGVTEPGGGWTRGITLNNCIVAGHKTGVSRVDERYSSGIFLYNTVLHNETDVNRFNDPNLAAASRGGVYDKGGLVYADPKFATSPTRYAHLDPDSPCLGAGRVSADVTLRPTRDLDGRPIRYDRPLPCGCFCRDPLGTMLLLR